ncbi:MAG TPA: AAA family ATPase [Candidatus Paceibacterota bacterium]|nr:AAA family ATPase [Candidatus Paceibacterota bacterium]
MKWSVIGHEKQKVYFADILKTGRFAHAYLFTGPEMVGKRTFATELISAAHGGAVVGVSDPYAVRVGAPDRTTIEIEEDIRPLRSALHLRPPSGVRLFVIMDDADRMSRESANALLKLLEEPPAYVTFMLITARPAELPATVRSRCHQVRFAAAADSAVADDVGRKLPAKSRDALVALAGGRIGWVRRVLRDDAAEEIIASGAELDQRLGQGVAERLAWAKAVADRDDRRELVGHWLAYSRPRLASEPGLSRRLHGLLELYDMLGQPQFNARLAVEHFLLTA